MSIFDNVNLADFGLEDNGTAIDQNVSIDGGGATAQTAKYFTRDELIAHVAENGIVDEQGNLTEKGRTYLLNDQGFLDAYPTPEEQEVYFDSFNKSPDEKLPISSMEDFMLGPKYFDDLMRAQGWLPDEEKNKGEATPVHSDGNEPQEPTDKDTSEVAPQENELSLEAFMLRHISLEDPSVPLNHDGSVPSNLNTQMAVMPVNDPTKPKTLEELYGEMDLEPAPTVTDDTTQLSVDEAVIINTRTNGILASTGFDLTTAVEDLAAGENPNVMAEIDVLQAMNTKLRERENEATDIINNLIEKGGVDKEMASQLETLRTGIITTRYSLESFGTYPTLMGYKESLEAADAVKFGAIAAGSAVLFGMLIKLVMWIRDKLKTSNKFTEQNREAVRKVTQSLNSELIRIERDYSDDLSKNEKFKANYVALAKKYSLRATFGSTSLLEVNDGIRTFVVHKNLKPKFNDVMKLMIESDKIQQVARSLIDSINALLPAVEGNVHSLLNKFAGNDELNIDDFKVDFKFIEGVEKIIGITSTGTEVERLTYFNDKFKKLLEPNSGASTPTFNKLIEFKFDINGAFAFDDKCQKQLAGLLNDLAKLKKQAETITDKTLADNRNEIINLLKSHTQAVMRLVANVIAIRECAGILLKGTSGATKEAIAAWKGLFSNTGITFNM